MLLSYIKVCEKASLKNNCLLQGVWKPLPGSKVGGGGDWAVVSKGPVFEGQGQNHSLYPLHAALSPSNCWFQRSSEEETRMQLCLGQLPWVSQEHLELQQGLESAFIECPRDPMWRWTEQGLSLTPASHWSCDLGQGVHFSEPRSLCRSNEMMHVQGVLGSVWHTVATGRRSCCSVSHCWG